MYISISVKNLEATCVVNGAIFCCVVRDKEDKKGSAFLICSSSYLVGKFFVFVCFFSFNLFTYISIHHKSSQQPGIASTQSKSKMYINTAKLSLRNFEKACNLYRN